MLFELLKKADIFQNDNAGRLSSDKEDSAKEKKAQSATTETTEDPKQKAEKDDWLEIGQTYVMDDGLGSKLNVTINDVGTEDVMEYGTFGEYIEAVYLDCSFKNVGEEEEYINTDLFHFYADNQPVETDISNSMNMVSLSPERETSGLFYA